MRLGRRLDVRAAGMGAAIALYPIAGPAVIGTVLAVRARDAVIAPWGLRGCVKVPRDGVGYVRTVEFVRPEEKERLGASQSAADYGFLERAANDRRPRRRGRRAA